MLLLFYPGQNLMSEWEQYNYAFGPYLHLSHKHAGVFKALLILPLLRRQKIKQPIFGPCNAGGAISVLLARILLILGEDSPPWCRVVLPSLFWSTASSPLFCYHIISITALLPAIFLSSCSTWNLISACTTCCLNQNYGDQMCRVSCHFI